MYRGLTQLIQEHLRLFQIGRLEPFGEPGVDWGEQIDGPAALVPLGQPSYRSRPSARSQSATSISAPWPGRTIDCWLEHGFVSPDLSRFSKR
jgi:hypothetical protein